jgi:hypothetical protein
VLDAMQNGQGGIQTGQLLETVEAAFNQVFCVLLVKGD